MRKRIIENKTKETKIICSNCGKEYIESDYGKLTRFILGNHKPACSYGCNKALNQVK